jgi:hypothetical protein
MLKGYPALLVVLFLVGLMAGCRAESLVKDQRSMRSLLLDAYQDEVLDNIVRTSLSLPIMDVVYSNATGTATNANVATLTGGTTDSVSHAATPTHMWQYMFSLNNANTVNNQLTLTGSPVFDREIFSAYSKYLRAGTAEEKYRLQYVPTKDKIPKDAFLTHYFKYNGEDRYYYIPRGNEKEFFFCYEAVTTQAYRTHGAAKNSVDALLNEQTIQRLNSQP